ncbi:PREDICTED: phytosulfokine receptor 1 isoform X2 [Theobroma cacao]|uniref:Phytosulfokine receptor 1 isoform X2 n=1 Tax=Theobroma cacao TaxID=3641 RepID=A0AB32VQR8_THECC|nr:PREDICTED: phytosulfokine receptor 1 isoform X2 [Theobroma cacao]
MESFTKNRKKGKEKKRKRVLAHYKSSLHQSSVKTSNNSLFPFVKPTFMGISKVSLAFILLVITFRQRIQGSQEQACNSKDLTALKGFSKCLGSDIGGWNWNSFNCCSWTGITCDNSSFVNKRVVGLELGNKRLAGTICETLVGLEQVRILNLSHNFLHGKIPTTLFRFQNLEVLDLSNNDFVGSLPVVIHLPSIKYFDLSKNHFSSLLSLELCKTSSHIRYINLANNFFGEASLYLENCTSLHYVHLNGNGLSGAFPENLFRLQHLRILHLQENRFSGPLHYGIGNLSNLVELDISSNGFNGSLPDFFGRLRKLDSFSAGSNRLTGLLPISLVNSPSLSMVDLRNNSLNGPININCSAMTRIASLRLASNNFQGPVSDLSSCQSLRNLDLARNKLGGEVPFHFKNLQALKFLSLAGSGIINISSALEILQDCKNLTILVLSLNFYHEEMPSNVNLKFRSLKALVIPNCHLKGSLPIWLSGCSMLQLLDLSWNSLGGSIPFWLGNFIYLFYLDLSNNSFSGEIPESLTGLESLVHNTVLLKELPADLRLVKSTGHGGRLLYNNIWSFPPTIDLSCNKLTGPIWPSFGNLKNLHVLSLEGNDLSGTIPDSMSEMTSLEELDLSRNKLSGEIPNSLVHLSFLSKFNVSYNELYGDIPSGGQFTTFPESSFEGNEALCTRMLRPCQIEQAGYFPKDEKLIKDATNTKSRTGCSMVLTSL